MTNFKGTKGKWIVKVPKGTNGWVEVIYPDGYCVVRTKDYIEKKEDYGKKKFLKNSINHAKLIAHAPEMLEEMEETITDLKILRNQISFESKTVNHWVGMPELIDKWIERKEQLIKKATE